MVIPVPDSPSLTPHPTFIQTSYTAFLSLTDKDGKKEERKKERQERESRDCQRENGKAATSISSDISARASS